MKNLNSLEKFTNLYSLSKTLRFELIPQGKTLENIQNHGLLTKDENRAESYKKVKKLIDSYHKVFINEALEGLTLNGLDVFYDYYKKTQRTDDDKKAMSVLQTSMRKQIAERFSKHPNQQISEKFKNLFAKELIKEDLKNFVSHEDLGLVAEFDNFTTYFTGFHENRKNIYTSDEISTSIGFRLAHQNLLYFIDNMNTFEKISASTITDVFSDILKDLSSFINLKAVEDAFSIDFFNETLTQTGIDKYNLLLGGYTSDDNKTKIKGLNEFINLFNQQQNDKTKKIGKLKPLFKQILSDRNAASYLPEAFESDNELLESIEKSYHDILEAALFIKKIVDDLENYDLSKIYVKNDTGLTSISQKIFGNWATIQLALEKDYELENPRGIRESEEKYNDKKSKWYRNNDSFSISHLNACIAPFQSDLTNNLNTYFKSFEYQPKTDVTPEIPTLLNRINNNYEELKVLLNSNYPQEKNLSQDVLNVEKIKVFLDSIKDFQHFVKPLCGKGNESDKDERFYGEFLALYEKTDIINLLYNKVRNYVTQKPYSLEKYKLNFDNSTLLNGWDENKEPDNTSIILRKNDLYYLAIINKNHKKVFEKKNQVNDGACYEKMVYKLLPGANKMLPKVFFSNSRIKEFNPSDELQANYDAETHKKGDTFDINHCHALIDFFKSSIQKHEDWKQFNFKFSETKSYQDLSGFYREVEQQGYKISFSNISEKYIDELVNQGKIYLFQIYNKDFSPYSKGKPNLHTLYWKMLFDEHNLQNVIYKLNGQAEIFFRKESIRKDNVITHLAQHPILNKNVDNKKGSSIFKYDIIKDKRFTVDKFQFHVPVTMNFKATGTNRINNDVCEFLKNNSDVHVIGIDRGERHLLYLTLINLKGEIINQYSLNEIVNEFQGEKHSVDYHNLLNKKEGNRDEARKNWKTIETIKDLKEGYLSQVVNIISKLMVEKKAIVVLEDLNVGFMRGRQKVEKQVYQKFEKMLIDKLNYLVDKNTNISEVGGVLKALQLTSKFDSFQSMGKQSGFLFYVPAWNTSKMDPTTGFVNLFSLKYDNISQAKLFFSKFTSIKFNVDKNWFEFSFDYSNFTQKAEGSRTKWVIIADNKDRYSFNRSLNNGKGGQELYKITERLELLFGTYSIVYGSGENLLDQINIQTSADFFKVLVKLFNVCLSLRHNNGLKGDNEQDYILSPVCDKNGLFFDSRFATEKQPKDADANGAYNIARKGLWVLKQIDKADNFKTLKLAISNKEWLEFTQNN
jgi:CRISPR-associated protein Cpf1